MGSRENDGKKASGDASQIPAKGTPENAPPIGYRHQRMSRKTPAVIITGTQHPAIFPTLRCRPLRDRGMPIFRESLAWACEMPRARLHENERPEMPVPRLRAISTPSCLPGF